MDMYENTLNFRSLPNIKFRADPRKLGPQAVAGPPQPKDRK